MGDSYSAGMKMQQWIDNEKVVKAKYPAAVAIHLKRTWVIKASRLGAIISRPAVDAADAWASAASKLGAAS